MDNITACIWYAVDARASLAFGIIPFQMPIVMTRFQSQVEKTYKEKQIEFVVGTKKKREWDGIRGHPLISLLRHSFASHSSSWVVFFMFQFATGVYHCQGMSYEMICYWGEIRFCLWDTIDEVSGLMQQLCAVYFLTVCVQYVCVCWHLRGKSLFLFFFFWGNLLHIRKSAAGICVSNGSSVYRGT